MDVGSNIEDVESGYVEAERMDSGLPTSMTGTVSIIHISLSSTLPSSLLSLSPLFISLPFSPSFSLFLPLFFLSLSLSLLILVHYSLVLFYPIQLFLFFLLSLVTEPSQESGVSTETEAQQALQALKDRQQMAFEVCDRMFNALLAWATTKDIRYLLAAQRSLTAVQNQEGDT